MANLRTWYGVVTVATHNQITITAGQLEGTYRGSFTYDQRGNVFGQLNSMEQKFNGHLQIKLSQMSVDAFTIFNGLNSNDLASLVSLVSSGDDIVVGSAFNDTFLSTGGNDSLDGGSGLDTVIFSGSHSDYSARQSSGRVIVTDSNANRDGTDTLTNIEVYRFSDGFVALSNLVAPTTIVGGVYRHFNSDTGMHFYTASSQERDYVINNISSYNYEGARFKAASADVPEAANVWRFYNSDTGAHFYTISEAERDYIIANLTSFRYEGPAYRAYVSEVDDSIALHRFFNVDTSTHFYTASEAEKLSIENSLPQYQYEGVAYYVEVA